MNLKSLLLMAASILLVFVACSSNNNVTFVNIYDIESYSTLPVLVSDVLPDGSHEGFGVMGLFSIVIDTYQLNSELNLLRSNTLKDVIEFADITNFLQLNPCIDCVKLMGIEVDENQNIALKIGIKHPFDAGDPFKPVSGRNRADLHVFNVEGTIVFNDSSSTVDFPSINATVAKPYLINPSGYSQYLDIVLDQIYPTSANLHPYILHFNDYSQGNFSPNNPMGFQSVTTPPPSGNLVMPMGSDYDVKTYLFNIPHGESFDFIFAVGCTYAVSSVNKNSRFNPEYRVPQHNKKAASEINVIITDNQLMGGIESSTADIEIHILDINHNVPVGEALNEMLVASNIIQVSIEIPEILLSTVLIDPNTGTGSGHHQSDPFVLTTQINNQAQAPEGDYLGMVKIVDSYSPGLNQSILLNGMDGLSRVEPLQNPLTGLFSITEFAAYQIIRINVQRACGPVTGAILNHECPILNQFNGSYLNFTVEASSAFGGDPITLYEADFNYNGVSFNVHDSNTDGMFNNAGPFNAPHPCDDNIPFTITVAFRASDSCNPPNITVFAICDITIDQCGPSFKDIPLRPDIAANDLAVTPEGDLLILYDDGEVWKYYESSDFQHSTANYIFTAEVVQSSLYSPPPVPIYAKNLIEVSDAGNIIASNSDGANCQNPPVGNYPTQSFSPNGTPLGSAGSHCTGGPIRDVFAYKSGTGGYNLHHVNIAPAGIQSNMYRLTYNSWTWVQQYGQDVHGLGYDKIFGLYIRAAESSGVNTFWALEDNPDYFCSEFIQDTFFYYHFNNKWFGVGYQTESDDGWFNAKDLTMDSRGNLYVLDEMNNGNGRVKGFVGDSSGGYSLGHFDIQNTTTAVPRRIEGSTVDGLYGNLIFILHGDHSDGFYLSVFFPHEIPW